MKMGWYDILVCIITVDVCGVTSHLSILKGKLRGLEFSLRSNAPETEN
jgi:hypothetical protein